MSDLIKVATPVGELHYVNISGQGKESYNEDGYEYVATVYLDKTKPEVAEFIARIEELKLSGPKDKSLQTSGYFDLFKDEEGKLFARTEEKTGGEPTNFVGVRFKTKTTFSDGKPKKITVYDVKCKVVDLGDRRVGNGTIGAIAGAMQLYVNGKKWGISMFLNSIQITKFIEYVGDAGFEEQEGDFEGFDAGGDFETKSAPESKAEEKPATKTKPKL